MNARIPCTSGYGAKPVPVADHDEAALIARGAGKWGDPEFPKTDWVCVDTTDRGEPVAIDSGTAIILEHCTLGNHVPTRILLGTDGHTGLSIRHSVGTLTSPQRTQWL